MSTTPARSARPSSTISPAPISPAKLRANRRNARKSTGPRTAAGRAVACRNATTHGLFCASLLLPGEDAQDFHTLRESLLRALKPQDAMELALVDRLVCDQWRLNRVQRAEAALYAGRDLHVREQMEKEVQTLERNFQFQDVTSAVRAGLHTVKEFTRYRELQDRLSAEPSPAVALASAMLTDDQAFERLARYEQRLQYSVHRCLRDLHTLRAKAEQYRDLPESPFLSREELGELAEPADAVPAEGAESAPEETADPVAEGTPAPGSSAAATASVQNEPTAAPPAASPARASRCDGATGGQRTPAMPSPTRIDGQQTPSPADVRMARDPSTL